MQKWKTEENKDLRAYVPISMFFIVWDIREYGVIYAEYKYVVVMDFAFTSIKESLLVNCFRVWSKLFAINVVLCWFNALFRNGFKGSDVVCFHSKPKTCAFYLRRTLTIASFHSEREPLVACAMAWPCYQNYCSNKENKQLHILLTIN